MEKRLSERRMSGLAEQFMSSWQSDIFRQRCTAQIEGIRSQTKPRAQTDDPVENFLATHTSEQLEDFVFNKSKTREEYMSLVSDMVMMLRQHAGKPSVDMSVLQNAAPELLAGAGVSQNEMDQISRDKQNGDDEVKDK